MIVKDEEDHLPLCLQSVQGVVDEIVIVDTGSTDRTIAIAREFGAAVEQQPWQDDFAAARNASIQLAQGTWILVLDADETLLLGCVDELKTLMQSPDLLVVNLLRQEIGSQQTPYTLLSRLFRRHPQIYFERPYHESIDDRVMDVISQASQWKIGTLNEPAIAHKGYQPDLITSRNKSERAARIMARYLADSPTDAYICSKLGALYVSQGQIAEGLALLEQGVRQSPASAAVCYELQFHLGLAYRALGQLDLARQHYQQALHAALPDLLKLAAQINLAALLIDISELDQAEMLLLQALQIQPDWPIAYYNLGLVYRGRGQLAEAVTAYRRSLQLQPNVPEPYRNLGAALVKLGQFSEGLEAFHQAILLYQQSDPAEAQRLQQQLYDLGWLRRP